jgi:hypothetical protein
MDAVIGSRSPVMSGLLTPHTRARLLRVVIVLLPLLVGIPRAYASLFVLGPMDLARSADAVVLGSVEDVQSAWEGGRIVSRASVRTQDTLKGNADTTIVVTVPGGTIDGIGMRVSGAPVFRTGDRSVVFLRSDASSPSRAFHVLGGTLGKVDVAHDENGRAIVEWVRPELHRVDVVPLAEFEQRVARATRGESP